MGNYFDNRFLEESDSNEKDNRPKNKTTNEKVKGDD